MKELVNSFDKEVSFTNLEDAKKYYYPSAEDDNQTKSSEDFLGEPSKFPEYLKQWDEYKNAIKSAETLEELKDMRADWKPEKEPNMDEEIELIKKWVKEREDFINE